MVSKTQHLRAGAVGLQPEGLLEGWRERRSGSMLYDDEEPERPSRTGLLGGQATQTCRSSARAGLLGGSLAWGCGQARRTAWASRQKVASPSARPCPAPASCDASRARPSGNRTEPPIAKLASAVKNKVRTITSSLRVSTDAVGSYGCKGSSRTKSDTRNDLPAVEARHTNPILGRTLCPRCRLD